jgi:hypothetical protein
VGGHLGRVVVEDLLHDVLGDVAVETGREQCSGRTEYLSAGGAAGGYSPGW